MPITDYTGMQIGDLKVLQKLPPAAGEKGSRYLCKCSCGNSCVLSVTKISRAYHLGQGAHCGCKKHRLHDIYIGHVGKRRRTQKRPPADDQASGQTPNMRVL